MEGICVEIKAAIPDIQPIFSSKFTNFRQRKGVITKYKIARLDPSNSNNANHVPMENRLNCVPPFVQNLL